MMCAMPSTSCRRAWPHLLVLQDIDARPQNAERRAQLVRGIGGEFALNPEPFFEPVQRLVDRGYQRAHLARNLFGRQPKAGARGPMSRAISEACRSGRSARRKIAMSATSSTSRIGSVIQPTFL